MKKTNKILGYGLISWLIPFLVAIPFYNQAGELTTDPLLFKSIMSVVGSAVGAFLIVRYFKSVKKNYLIEGFELGAGLLLVNLVLDVIVLIMLFKMPFMEYVNQIGLQYLVILITAAMAGKVAEVVK